LLQPEQILLFAHRRDQATPWELEQIAQHSLATIPLEEAAENPESTATEALKKVADHCDQVLVHFDVDVIDFTDAPLSENTDRNIGLLQRTAFNSLAVLLESPLVSALKITELNPEHGEPDGQTLKTFAESLAFAMTGVGSPTSSRGAVRR
jgi:arginase